MKLVMISVFLLTVSQAGNQAEKAFRASEKKLSQSDTIQISFTCNTSPDKKDSESRKPIGLSAPITIEPNITRLKLVLIGASTQMNGRRVQFTV
jgi:hypothetical protein